MGVGCLLRQYTCIYILRVNSSTKFPYCMEQQNIHVRIYIHVHVVLLTYRTATCTKYKIQVKSSRFPFVLQHTCGMFVPSLTYRDYRPVMYNNNIDIIALANTGHIKRIFSHRYHMVIITTTIEHPHQLLSSLSPDGRLEPKSATPPA